MNPYIINVAPQRMTPRAGTPDPAKDVKMEDFMKEISWSESDILKYFSPFGGNFDPIVRQKGLKIYQEMMEDEQVKVCMEIRKQSRLSTPWNIVAGEDGNTEAQMYADFIKHCLDRLSGTFEDDLYQIYSAFEYGFSVTEKIFEILPDGPFKGKIGLKALKTREPFFYDFKIDPHGNLLGMTYIGPSVAGTNQPILEPPSMSISNQAPEGSPGWANGDPRIQNLMKGKLSNPFPIEKFIVYSYNMQFSNWYGRSDLLSAFRPWTYKKHIMKFWSIWLERYASPFLVAQYKRDAGLKPSVLATMDDFLRNLTVRNGIRVSDAWTLTPIQFSSSTNSVYGEAIQSQNSFIAHALLVPNLLGFTEQQQKGAYAIGVKQFDAFVWILNKVGRDTSETIVGEQIIRQLIDFNFPNVPEKHMPRFTFESVDDSSVQVRATILQMLAGAGFINPEEEWVREYLSMPKKDPDIVLPPTAAALAASKETKPGEQPPPGEKAPKGERKPVGDKTVPAEKPRPAEKPNAEKTPNVVFVQREPDRFEQKMQPMAFRAALDATDAAMAKEMSAELSTLFDKMLKDIARWKIVEGNDPAAIQRLSFNVGGLRKILSRWLIKVYLDAKLKLLEELGRAGLKVEIQKRFDDIPQKADWEPLPPSDAIDFFNKKVIAAIITKNGERRLIDLATRQELPYLDQKAFTISGIVRDDILNDAKQILLNGIKRQDQPGTISDLKDMFNKYIDQGIAVDDQLLRQHRLATIVRTNTAEAINEGRAAMMTNENVGDFVPYWQYTAIIDDRTTAYCMCMNGKKFRIEQLDALKPPAHFNCRSFSVPITQFEVEDLKTTGAGVEIGSSCPGRMSGFESRTVARNLQSEAV